MRGSAGKIQLASLDDFFGVSQGQTAGEPFQEIPLSDLHPFQNHPFHVTDDEKMQEMGESVAQYGVLVPGIVRPRPEGSYELVSGHRRKRACELAGLPAMPVFVRELDDDEATLIMVDSNLQRENISPMEKAQAYKMKLDAIKRRSGERTDLTSAQLGQRLPNKTSRDLLAENAPDSSSQIQRLIRLTELSPELQQMVDDKKIAVTPAVELSYLKPEEQALVVETIESEQATPSLSQAQRMKKKSQAGELNEDAVLSIMSEEKKPEKYDLTISGDKLRKYFPRSYTPRQMEDTILKLLEGWQRKRQRSQER